MRVTPHWNPPPMIATPVVTASNAAGSSSAPSAGWITLAEAARLADCHPSVVERLALRGSVRHAIVRGRVRYALADVERLAAVA
jgi:hypothetical protein